MATSFTFFVDSTNFFTLATFPNEVSIRDISRSLANCRLDPFDPRWWHARRKKVWQVISSTACSERPDKPIYLETCATSWMGCISGLGWRNVTRVEGRLSTQLFRGCWWNFWRVETAKRKSGEIGMNRVLEEFAMRLALGRLVQMNCSSSSFVFVFIFESTSFDLSN